jgi:phosphoglycolate phosphatase
MRFDYLIFDLDGTLVDTTPALAVALGETLAGLGRRAVSVDAIARITGHGLRALLRSAILMTGGPIGDRELGDAVATFRTAYERVLLDCAIPAEGACAFVHRATAAGARVAVLTNKPTASSIALLAHLGYGEVLDYVVGGDLDVPRKPDPGGVFALLEHWKTQPERALLIGSSRVDLKAGRNAEIQVALICPFGARQRIFGLGADFTVDSFEQLEPLVLGASK